VVAQSKSDAICVNTSNEFVEKSRTLPPLLNKLRNAPFSIFVILAIGHIPSPFLLAPA